MREKDLPSQLIMHTLNTAILHIYIYRDRGGR